MRKAARINRRFIFRVMKLTAFLLSIVMLQATAKGVAQTISLEAKELPITQVFEVIKQQTGYIVFCNKELLKKTLPVTISANRMPLLEFLNNIFENQPLQYEIRKKSIIISRKFRTVPVNNIFQETLPINIKGRITGENGEPVIASIIIKGTTKGTASDIDGYFELNNVPEGSVLIITAVGMQKVEIAAQPSLAVVIKKANNPLDEVQIIAYGTSTERTNVGSVSTVRSEQIARQPVADVLQALQSNVPGLEINQNSGMAGTGYTKIQVRGVNSIASGSTPLFLIDGVQVTGVDSYEYGINPFIAVSPENIESVTVLKDADATAIYGSRGANGVILITTKKGKSGKTKVTANISAGINRYTHLPEMVNTEQYLTLRNEAFKNDGEIPDEFTAPDLFGYGINSDINRYTKWSKQLLGTSGNMQDVQFGISGGTNQTTFAINAAMHRETPPLPASFSFKRPSVSVNVSHKSVDNRFNTSISAMYSSAIRNFTIEDVAYYLVLLPPNLPALTNDDGTFNFISGFNNPFSTLAQPAKSTQNSLIANANIGYEIIRGLTIKSSFGFSEVNKSLVQLTPLKTYDPSWGLTSGSASFVSLNSSNWQIEPQVEYIRNFGQGKLTALAGATYQHRIDQDNLISATDYSTESLLEDYSAASTITVRRNYANYKYAAIFARLNYNLREKYLLNLTARRDGSSRFGPSRPFGNFGAVGAGWIFSGEDFIKNSLPWLSFGKIRASYGITGNDQIGDYQYLDTYGPTVSRTSFGATFTGLLYNGQTTLSPTALYNSDYGWESTRKKEIGLDLGFLNDRILLYLTWYNNRSSSQLINYTLAPTTGFGGILRNFPALIGNHGFEFLLNTVNVSSRNFTWSSSINFSVPRNKLIEFPDLGTSSYVNTYVIGQPLSIIKAYKYIGVDPETGIYTFEDAEGKLTTAPTPNDDQQKLINIDRKFYGGFSNTFKYWRFRLIVDLQYVKQTNYDFNITTQNAGGPGNYSTSVMSRWQNPGDITNVQKFTQNFGSEAYAAAIFASQSSRAYRDGSFLRCKNISLSYEFNQQLLDKLNSDNVRVYCNAQNLFTVTNYPGFDPETGGLGFLPPMRSIVLGIQCSF